MTWQDEFSIKDLHVDYAQEIINGINGFHLTLHLWSDRREMDSLYI